MDWNPGGQNDAFKHMTKWTEQNVFNFIISE